MVLNLLEILKNNNVETIDKANQNETYKGYFLGIIDRYVFLMKSDKTILALKVPPYTINFINKISVMEYQELEITYKGMNRSLTYKNNEDFKRIYLNFEVKKNLKFYIDIS